ncbi:MAG: adenylate/guanylate cyclase domain-containing protein [Candidatus Microbacterium phytovorans]|uniref:Adenylate/guanylate cyclase domain-containing protein n=1 Tax=Candidatus Microbacterium phytovorans TaxID=3121374 RepID=A0AAJ5W0G9_9MICO|nr:adenylate/guanylate cyclase domain-containing protein [Microbacterium sp.]WEK12968.1 MAG: adenylate/guanylate cyclase domain-containing protein [Microbacterium sp.]
MAPTPPNPPATRRLRGGLGIQSKLLVMLLLVAVVSISVTGVIGFLNGRDSLRDAAFEQMTTIRELRANELESALRTLQNGVKLDSRTLDTVEASQAFNAGFDELQDEPVTAEERSAVLDYYSDYYIPELEARSGQQFDPEALLPATPAGQHLQAAYTAKHTDYDESLAVVDAGDGSAWSAAHAKYHPYFKGLVDDLGYEDVLLINDEGRIVYTAYKGIDLGLSLTEQPMTDTVLTAAYTEVMRSNTLDAVVMTDFERYLPSLNVPNAWVVSPVGRTGAITGALAVQVPIDTINSVLTGNEGWTSQGFGATGEAYIVGADNLMRSVSRELVEHPDTYAERAIANGTPPEIAERIVAVNGTVLLQPVDTPAANRALRGESGTIVSSGYLGSTRLASFAPLDAGGPRWVIIASIEETEAFAPVVEFTRVVLLSAGALILLIAVLSLLLARVFTAPLNRLMSGVRRVAAGDRDVEVDTRTRDEFAELGRAFNDLSRNLQTKADLLDAERAESERMLLSLMPPAVADRYRQGDETIVEDHTDVTVIYADIVGFDDYTAELDSSRSLAALNEIFTGLDEIASRLGVERVRTSKQGYLASCGLSVPRVDSARRVVEFAAAAQAFVERLSAQWNAKLSLRAGIDSGSVTTGLVGRNSVIYDMWGDAVNLAHRLQGAAIEPGVTLSQRVVDRLGDMFAVTDMGMTDGKTGPQRAWRLSAEDSRV